MLQSYSSRYKTTKVHQYFSRNKINEPTNQNTYSASLSVSLTNQPRAYNPTTARA